MRLKQKKNTMVVIILVIILKDGVNIIISAV